MLSSRHLVTLAIGFICFVGIGRSQTSVSWAPTSGTATEFTDTLNWNPGSLFNNTSSSLAVFTGPAPLAQPNLGSAFSVAGVVFTSTAPAYTLSATGTNALTLGNSGIDNESTFTTQTISAPLIFTSTTSQVINQGTLTISGNVTNSAGVLTLKGAGANGTISGIISGTGDLLKDESGTWSLGGANTYSGNTTVKAGTLKVTANNAAPNGGNVLLMPDTGSSTTLDLGSTSQSIGTLTFYGALNGSATVTIGSSGTLTLGGDVTYNAAGGAATANITGGTLALGATRTFNVGSSSGSSGNDLIISSAVTGSGADLIKDGAGRLVLSGNNTYSGNTTVNAGRLQIASGGTHPSGGNVVVNAIAPGGNAAFDLGGTAQTIGSLTLAGAANSTNSVDLGPSGTLTINGSVRYDATNNPGTATISNGSAVQLGSATTTITVDKSTNSNNVDLSIMTPITGTGAVTKEGAGVLVLTGNNTYSGGTTIGNGTLQVGNGGTTGALAGDIVDNATLIFSRSDAATYSGVISGTGNVTLTGGGTLTLSGNSTYAGVTTVRNSTLTISSDANLGAAPTTAATNGLTLAYATLHTTGNVTLAANRGIILDPSGGGTLDVDTGTKLSYAGLITGSGSLTKAGNGTLELGGGYASTGNTYVKAGVLQDSAANAFSSTSDLFIANGARVNVTQDETIGGLFDDAAGSVGNISIASGKTLKVSMGGEFSGVIGGAGALTVDGYWSSLALTGNNTYSGGTTIGNSGVLYLGNGTIGVGSTTGAIVSGNIVNNGDLIFLHSDSITYGGISGTGAVKQEGSGTLTLNGTNSYTGGTYIESGTVTGALPSGGDVKMNGGTLAISTNQNIGSLGDWYSGESAPGNVVIGTGATLTLSQHGDTFSGLIYGNGALVIGNVSYEYLTGSATHTGGTTIDSGGSLWLGNGGVTGSLAGSITNNGQLYIDHSGNYTQSGGISGAGMLVQYGNGTTTLAGTNTYSGATLIESGTLTDAAAGSLSPNSRISFGSYGAATLNVTHDETVQGLESWSSSGNATVVLGAVTLTLKPMYYSTYYNGTITGSGSIVLAGGGREVLGAASTYTGNTTIQSGTLVVTNSSGSATGNSAIAISPGATLQIGNYGPGGAVSGNISNNGNVLFTSTDTTSVYGGVISGTGNLVLDGYTSNAGTLTLTGVNTYSGGTQIGNSTLQVGVTNAIPTTSRVKLRSGGTLALGADQTLQTVSADPAATIALGGNSTLTLAPSTGMYTGNIMGNITGAGALKFAGAAVSGVTLSGGNSFAGGTEIASGYLFVASNSALGTGAVKVDSGAALLADKSASSDVTLGNDVTLASGVTLGGSGGNNLGLNGNVTVASGASTVHLQNLLMFTGSLKAASGTADLTFDSGSGKFANAVFISPIDSSVTSLTANGAGVIFGSPTAPRFGLVVKGTNGYVGIAAATGTAPTAASVLSLIDPSFTGALGFDTPGSHTALAVFADAINLSTFGTRLTLGSVSGAVLTGTITPSSAGYLFGNGGGGLIVDSTLTGTNNVTVSSVAGIAGNGLTTVLRGANDFAGTVSVTNSSLVLDSAGALPAGRAVTLGANGYLGYTEAFTSAATFADFVKNQVLPGSYTGSSIIGVDSHAFVTDQVSTGSSTSSRTVGDTIDLSSLGPISLGTATHATLTGPIYAPAQGGANKALSLVAVGDGQLTVSSSLLVGNVGSVTIGSNSGNANGTVVLNGLNTYTGGTTLISGTLVLNRNGSGYIGPIGNGTLTVATNAIRPTLVAGTNGGWIPNSIALGSNLQVGVTPNESSSSLLTGLTNTWFSLSGAISDAIGSSGGLDIHANTSLDSANTFSGGVKLSAGQLELGNDAALGTGTLTFSPGTDSSSNNVSLYLWNMNGTPTSHTISNNLVYDGVSRGSVYLGSNAPVTFTGSLQLNSDLFFAAGQTTSFTGPISGYARFGVSNGWARTTLSGSNTYSGGTYANWGVVVFANSSAMPATPVYNAFSSESGGYIGIGFVPTTGTLQSTFISRFDPGKTYGSIGFDSASASAPNTFSDAVDLSNFSTSPRLGSATHAILSGTITPRYTTYNFGGGGGLLEITSALTDSPTSSRSVNVDSYSQPTIVRLAGSNTFTGGVQVYSSGLVFASGALPATGSLFGNYGAFIGTEDPTYGSNPSGFVNRIDASSSNLIVGFNTNVTGNISFAQFTGTADPAVSLGTSTSATISSQSITLPTAQTAYRFAGYRGGQLTVQTVLADLNGTTPRSVVIGDTNGIGTWASSIDPDATISSVTLTGANTYTGGTTLNAAHLFVANDSALGTGALTFGTNYGYSNARLGLYASGAARNLANAIVMGNASVELGGAQDLTLSGVLSGNGTLNKVGAGTLTLSGANTLSSYIMIQGGSIVFASDTANGTGNIGFNDAGGASVTFAGNNTVSGIWGNATDTINLAAGKTLTFDLQYGSSFNGTIAGTTGGLVVRNSGSSTTGYAPGLYLDGANTFSGPITVQGNATLYAFSSSALGAATNPVTVTGGAGIYVGGGIMVQNPISVTAGTIGGFGTYKVTSAANAFTIGSGVTIAPGYGGGTGTLSFDGSLLTTSVLILASGGTYNWELTDATNGGWDRVSVTGTVNLSATAALPFNFKLGTLAAGYPGLAANFDPTKPYSWTMLTATSITGYTGWNQFNIDRSGFMNLNSGVFTVNLNSTQTALTLDFNPVPEPSTYALILAGLGITFLVSRRRRCS